MSKTYTIEKPSHGGMIEDTMHSSMVPSLYVDEKQFPPIKGWMVGNKYKIEIEVEMVGMNKDKYETRQLMRADLAIRKMTNLSESDDVQKGKKGYE